MQEGKQNEKGGINAMINNADDAFIFADNEKDGNLYYLEKEGGTHTGKYAMQYFYNGLRCIWKNLK